MVSALSLFIQPDLSATTLDGDWRLKSTDNQQGYELGFADPAFDDAGWQVVRLPHLRHATVDQDTLWYRCHFDASDSLTQPSNLDHILLRLGGSFYRTQVWMNGAELGSHEGYFQPFGFDVTSVLKPTGNVIAVRCHFPVEAGSFKRKTAVAGIFTDWDCKPYPSQFYPHLPAPNEWTVPIGLWQPVCLYRSGPVVMQSLTLLPEVVHPQWGAGTAESAAVRVKAVVRNLTAEAQSVEMTTELRGQGALPPMHSTEISLAANEQREVELTLKLNQPRLWFPWTHGQPHLYEARLTLKRANSSGEVCYAQRFGVREIKAIVGPGQWEWWLNGRRVFLKGSNYVSDFYLDRVSPENLRRDLDLAKGANLDLLRVHAHIAPTDFYRLCDELGMLVMCDFPLIWTYGFNLPPGEDAAFRASVRTQVEDMVRLLGSHASIGLWSMHNEPPWTPDGSFLGSDVHETETNRQMDLDSAARVDLLDPTRPAISASGIYDQHLYHGWYTGHWSDNRALHPSFPTEFGVQALPNLDSPFWATVNTTWPVDVEDVTWAHSGYSSIFWVSPGVGAPSQYDTLAGYIEESQAYQAFYIRYVIDQWRRQKFSPTGGYIHFLFTDGWPAITWSVLDYYRLPKAGYTALAEASRPVRVCFYLNEGYRVERAFHLAYSEGATLNLGLWLVNDDYRRTGDVLVEYWFEAQDGMWNRLRRALRWWRVERINTALPGAGETAKLIHTVEQALQKNGNYAFVVQTRQGNTVLDTNRLEFRVGEVRTHAKAPRHVPGLLVNRVYMKGSLQHTQDGFTFSLLNPAMPVNLIRLGEMVVDGTAIDPASVDLMRGGVARRASSVAPQAPLEIPSGERFTIVVRNLRLTAGNHEIQITAEFAGLGEVSAKIKDKLI